MSPLATAGFSDEYIQKLLHDAQRMALRWCHSSADVEDVAQEAVIRLIAAKKAPANVPAWLFVVTRRLCNRIRLRELARLSVERDYHSAARWSEPAVELRLDVEAVLARLNARDRRLMLRVLAGEVSSAIAREFGCRERDVGQMVARARRKARLLRHRR